jgi:hypothetical protein
MANDVHAVTYWLLKCLTCTGVIFGFLQFLLSCFILHDYLNKNTAFHDYVDNNSNGVHVLNILMGLIVTFFICIGSAILALVSHSVFGFFDHAKAIQDRTNQMHPEKAIQDRTNQMHPENAQYTVGDTKNLKQLMTIQ